MEHRPKKLLSGAFICLLLISGCSAMLSGNPSRSVALSQLAAEQGLRSTAQEATAVVQREKLLPESAIRLYSTILAGDKLLMQSRKAIAGEDYRLASGLILAAEAANQDARAQLESISGAAVGGAAE